MARASCRIASIAVKKRSSSAFGSDFGRLDHQRAGNGPAHRRRMETAVDQTLGDILDARRPHFPSTAACRRCTHGRPVPSARCRGWDNAPRAAWRCSWRSGSRPWSPASVPPRPSAGNMPRRSSGSTRSRRGRPRPSPRAAGFGMTGKVRDQVLLDADRSHAGAAAAMRNAEGLVQIEVARRRRRSRPAPPARPSRSCWRRRYRPVRRAHG